MDMDTGTSSSESHQPQTRADVGQHGVFEKNRVRNAGENTQAKKREGVLLLFWAMNKLPNLPEVVYNTLITLV